MAESLPSSSTRQKVFYALLFLVGVALALTALMIPLLAKVYTPAPEVGQVALQEYDASQSITYVSEVLTEQRRDAVENSVQSVYTPLDTSVARQQLEQLRETTAYITSVRADAYATQEQKLDDLAALDDIQLSYETATIILDLTDARWQAIQQEAIVVLEKVMSNVIRPEHLNIALNRVPATVSLTLSESQAAIVAELASAFIAPNSEYSEVLTQDARQEARQSVEPVNRSYVAGQTVVLRGHVLDEIDIEALQRLGLVEPEGKWQDLVSAIVLVLLLAVYILYYIRRNHSQFTRDARSVTLMAVLFLGFLSSARLIIPSQEFLPYVFPLAAYGLTIAVLFGAELALISALPLSILSAYGMPNAMELTLYFVMTSFFGVLALGRARRITAFFWGGAAVAVSGSAVILIFRLSSATVDITGLATLIGMAFVNGLASASITALLQFFLAQFLGMTTPMQLMDLSRPDHPLLQSLLRDAPGTYQHSLQVANLAEQAAEWIGADPLLTRVGALYHDVGKTLNPVFYIENQAPGYANPHDTLDPAESANIIIHHVIDGLELGRMHHLPSRILDFIAEHHGTMITRYQYVNAVKAAEGDKNMVDTEQYRYPGPRPQSRETAILMLADGSEAIVRAERPAKGDELRELIREVVDARISSGQLDDTNLTLQDLNEIVNSFTTTLRGIYHPRVKYPQLEPADPPETFTIPITQPAEEVESPAGVSPEEMSDVSVDQTSS